MNYKKYVEIVKLEDITDEFTVEPTEKNRPFTFMPSYYQTPLPTKGYTTSVYNNDYTEKTLIIVFSCLSSILFVLSLVWYKYNRKQHTIQNRRKNIPIKNSYKKSSNDGVDEEFGTIFILDDNV